MTSKAFYLTAFANVGLSGDFGGTYFLNQLIGSARAKQAYMFSERILADEALALGLTSRVVEPDVFESELKRFIQPLVNGPSTAFRFMKENLNRAIDGNMEDCMDIEATHHVNCTLTQDHQEAVKAFIEKRVPNFNGY